jgi:hypothetical protein
VNRLLPALYEWLFRAVIVSAVSLCLTCSISNPGNAMGIVPKKKSLPHTFAQCRIVLFFIIYEPGLQNKQQHDKCG